MRSVQPVHLGGPVSNGPASLTNEEPPLLRGLLRRRRKKRQSRPISRVLSWTVILLGATSPWRSSNLPGPDAGRAMRTLFGLAPGGVCRAGLLPDSRCALTAPFHPYRLPEGNVGGIFLLHFPSARAAQALPGTLPCGARTFLGIPEGMTRLSGRLCRAQSTTVTDAGPWLIDTDPNGPVSIRSAGRWPAALRAGVMNPDRRLRNL